MPRISSDGMTQLIDSRDRRFTPMGVDNPIYQEDHLDQNANFSYGYPSSTLNGGQNGGHIGGQGHSLQDVELSHINAYEDGNTFDPDMPDFQGSSYLTVPRMNNVNNVTDNANDPANNYNTQSGKKTIVSFVVNGGTKQQENDPKAVQRKKKDDG